MMDALLNFLDMGGYAFYVWTSYLFGAVVFGLNLILPLRDRKRVMKMLKARAQRDEPQSGQTGVGE